MSARRIDPGFPERIPWGGTGDRPARAACAAVLGLLLLAAPARGQSSPNVSLDDPAYRFLEHLDTLGLVDSQIRGIRPFTRLEAARLLVEAEDLSGVRSGRTSPLIRSRIGLFHAAFRAEMGGLLETDAGEGATSFKPLQSLYARYSYLDGTETPEGDAGRVLREGSQVLTGFTTHAVLFDVLSLHARPELRVRPPEGPDEEDRFVLAFLETYAKLAAWNVELEGGLDSMSWGQGFHDTLMLSNDAEPLPLFKISNPMPSLLPWIFQAVGPLRTQIFLSRLDAGRPVPHPWIAGMKLSWKPLPFFELGAARTFLFGGEGGPHPDWGLILMGAENNNSRVVQTDVSDQRAGFDARLRIPLPGGGASFYAEAFGEDEANYFPSKWSTLFGVHLAGFLPQRNLWLRAEWARTHAAAYGHSTFAPGYYYQLADPGHNETNSALGHHVGAHSQDVYAEIGMYVLPEAELALVGDWEERRRGRSDDADPEEHVQAGFRAAYRIDWLGGLSLSMEYRYRGIRNSGYVRGERDRDSHFLFQVDLQF